MTTETRHDMAASIFYWHLPDSAHESGCALRCGYDGDDLCKHLADELENAGLLGDASELWKAVLVWAERFDVGDLWDAQDLHDLESALQGTVEAHPTAHWRREIERLKAEHLAFTSRLGFGDDVSEPAATLDEMIDPIEEAFSEARIHNECPVICNGCGETLASQVCSHCHGSGSTANPQLAFSECEWCAGAGRIHPGCVEVSYADLVVQRDAALTREAQALRDAGDSDEVAAYAKGVADERERIATAIEDAPRLAFLHETDRQVAWSLAESSPNDIA